MIGIVRKVVTGVDSTIQVFAVEILKELFPPFVSYLSIDQIVNMGNAIVSFLDDFVSIGLHFLSLSKNPYSITLRVVIHITLFLFWSFLFNGVPTDSGRFYPC